jgi:hypothetical protein
MEEICLKRGMKKDYIFHEQWGETIEIMKKE